MSTHSLLTLAQHDANAKEIYDFWVANGFSHVQACGMVANADAECSCDPTLVGDQGKAYGLHQWHDDRRLLIRDGGQGYKGCGIDVKTQTDLPSQLMAALWELTHSEHHAFGLIKATGTAYEVGSIICSSYERSGLSDQADKRGKRAQTWDKYFTTLAAKAGNAGG